MPLHWERIWVDVSEGEVCNREKYIENKGDGVYRGMPWAITFMGDDIG